MTNLPVHLNVAQAPLPARYESAKVALAECHRHDECKDWADKAEAMASYARQAGDDKLLKMAVRIKSRAMRRCGELLKEYQTGAKGGRPSENGGGAPTVSQRQAAEQAGMSKDQEVTARRLADIPEDQFEAAVESDDPPTVTTLADMGRSPSEVVGDRPPENFLAATNFIGASQRMAEFCKEHTADFVRAGLSDREIGPVHDSIRIIISWCDAMERIFAGKSSKQGGSG